MLIPVLYIAPWVDHGGTDKATVDWFRALDRKRFPPSLITTQPSSSRRLGDVVPYAAEVWPLPDLMAGKDFPRTILDFIHSRGIRVVHMMNSRLAFDMLPAIASLPHPPAVVVQLHVEEDDRSGFVQYVTTRYGNLVDTFSVVSRDLMETVVEDYEMPRSKCRTIHLGIDAAEEFSPERVKPAAEVEPGRFNVLYPVRLVTQKDPLAMVAAAAALRESGVDFRFHVLGEGHLEPDVREAIASRGLDQEVLLHGSRSDMPGWFAACDALLLTSVYEGVPVAVYEAMAMKLPIVAPRLDPIAEVLDDETATLLDPGSQPERYAEALKALASNPKLGERQGEAARARVLKDFTLEKMAREHEKLYEEIAPPEQAQPTADSRQPTELRFRTRPTNAKPLVSAVIPCYDQGRFLEQCLDSIQAQTYPNIETIVVDDASRDPETLELMERLGSEDGVTLLRMERNSGPGAARNAGIDRAGGRYVLPVDADNLLPPDAVERMVEQLQGAGEKIGFVYPCIKYFGTRDDYFEPPLYNLYGLLHGNYCDTGSLIDREVFDAGLRFLEEPRMAHEDWDFFLKLGALDVRGEPSLGLVLRARKHGFTRSDTITFGEDPRETRLRHPELYGGESDPLGPLEVKRRWSPALSIVALAPPEDRDELEHRLAAQTCGDAELLVRSDEDWAEPASGPFVRRMPADLAATPGEALADAANDARGRFVVATMGTGAAELADSAFVEKLLRVFDSRPDLHAIAFADVADPGVHPWRPVVPGAAEPHAVAWRATQPQLLPEPLPVVERHPVAAIVRAYSHNAAPIQWRHLPGGTGDPDAPEPRRRADVRLRGTHAPRASQAGEKERRMRAEPLLPGVPRDWLPNFTSVLAWSPPETVLLHRFVDDATGMRIVSDHGEPPEGYRLEYWLGAANRFARPGTTRLTAVGDPVPHHYRTIPWDEPWDGPAPDERVIGNIEMPERPMLDQVFLAEHRATGQRVLVAGDADPIADDVEKIVSLGWIESYPSNPRRAPAPAHAPFGAVGLLRAVDRERRRHAYAAGEMPEGDVAGELGALLDMPERDTVPVWITPDGRLVAGESAPARGRPGLRDAARWTLAPASWEGFATPQARARAVGRRSLSSLRHVAAPRRRAAANGTPPAGWIYVKERPVTILNRELLPLYAWAHPVTRDQFLSTNPLEGGDLGYGEPTVIGWLLPEAPVTGKLGTEGKDIPWASRFGQNVRA